MIQDDNPKSQADSILPPPVSTVLDSELQLASDLALTEDLALALLKRADLPASILEQFAKNANALKLRKVRIAVATHPHTPRHISIPLVRQFYTLDLMRVSLSPTVAPDIKIIAEDILIARLKTITLGERMTLARRSSGRIAAALLLDLEPRVTQAALQNRRLTEALVIQAVLRSRTTAALVHAVARHTKWSLRREVQIALLRTEFLPPAPALEFSRAIPLPLLCEILANSRLPAHIKDEILNHANRIREDL